MIELNKNPQPNLAILITWLDYMSVQVGNRLFDAFTFKYKDGKAIHNMKVRQSKVSQNSGWGIALSEEKGRR